MFTGSFRNDQPGGAGKLQLASGIVYEGPFVNGVPAGEGKVLTPDGDTGRGHFVNGYPEGKLAFTPLTSYINIYIT
jgi:hypothetical protein